MATWAEYWASLEAAQRDPSVQPVAPPSAYQQDPVGTGPAQGDVTRDDYGQPIQTHYNQQLFGTNDMAQQWAQRLGGEVIAAPSREAGGGTPGAPWTMPQFPS